MPIERRERLVEQQKVGLERDGAGERHALLLAAGELARQPAFPAGQAHEVDRLAGAPAPLHAEARRASAVPGAARHAKYASASP